MIIQLANGRVIECSSEVYFSLTDDELQELEGLGPLYTKHVGNPFYSMFHKGSKSKNDVKEFDDEYEPGVDEIDDYDKWTDPYFNSED